MDSIPDDLFFETFFAALFNRGLRYIDARTIRYHLVFGKCMEYLEAQHLEWRPVFIPHPFSGRYLEFNRALGDILRIKIYTWGGYVMYYELCPLQSDHHKLTRLTADIKVDIEKIAEIFHESMQCP